MAVFKIRTFGDPALRVQSEEVTKIDSGVKKLATDLFDTLKTCDTGIGLAANQIGVLKQVFVYDIPETNQRGVIINPKIDESRGEWTYKEGCLSVPGLSWEIVRPKEIHLTGYDLKENEVSIEADELLSRLFQHELDHLNGIMLIDRLSEEQKKEAKSDILDFVLANQSVLTL
jgi:peptide deformylase